jgi:hypothetical protein
MTKEFFIEKLNDQEQAKRIRAVFELKKLLDAGLIEAPKKEGYTNNHVHTTYSFSPYSPAKAVWEAYASGLDTVGIMDHDAIGGAKEFIEAGKILGIATTIGFEIRTDWDNTSLCGKRINNPDQISNAYISAHGLPHDKIEEADRFLSSIRSERQKRNKKMVDKLDGFLTKSGIRIDYETDVLANSYFAYGGEVTERHILFALSKKLADQFGKGQALIDLLKDAFGLELDGRQARYLADAKNPFYEYDLLNILKSSMIRDIYIDADKKEAIPVQEAVNLIKTFGAIPSYCYLGDVGDSPTGDKKAQKFEDDYLEQVFTECKRIGFQAIAYMPSRNTESQLNRVIRLCEKYAFLQISGEDINQPRQSFICAQLKKPKFSHLIDTTWALVGHEISATQDREKGIFADNSEMNMKKIKMRIKKYKAIGIKQLSD